MQLIKISRLAAWVLFATIFLYFISGYGMTKGIIDKNLSIDLHQNILPLITVIAFVVHVSISTKHAFMRWRIWNKLIKLFTIISFAIFFLLFLYFQYFYQPLIKESSSIPVTENSNQIINKQTQRVFTVSELAKYDGKNGNPAYAVVDGIVYDLSTVFDDGEHFGHEAGQDLTNAFYTKHAKSELEGYPVVGILK
jgi:predicted heme/steroid binding protein